MNTYIERVIVTALAGILGWSLMLTSPAAAEIQVGLAQVDITPPAGGRTTGYAAAQPTDGIHDPLSARAVFLKSDTTAVVLVSWDLCVINSPWLFEQTKALGIDHLLLANTHTHAGPKLEELDFPAPGSPWRRTIEERVLQAIKEALQSGSGEGSGHCG